MKPQSEEEVFPADCPHRIVFDEITDKWTAMTLTVLENGPRRFNAIKRRMEGITQKSLTTTLRKLERSGLISRKVIPVSPVAVEYDLTPLGRELLGPFKAVYAWIVDHQPELEKARKRFEAKNKT